jgi:O-antigen ligase
LVIAAIGTAVFWLVPYLASSAGLAEWIVDRWYLLVCLPAFIFGLCAYRHYGGFAKSPALIVCSSLMGVGVIWTDATERGRGALLAAAFLVTLPLSALIRKQRFVTPVLLIFSVATAISLLYAATISISLRQRVALVDTSGIVTTNLNSVGAQAALATLFALFVVRANKRLQASLLGLLIAVLTTACLITASRTAFIALAGAFTIALVRRSTRSAVVLAGSAAFVLCCSMAVNAIVSPGTWFYEGIVSRLVLDNEGTRMSLGARTQIWSIAAKEFVTDGVWLHGAGTGGVDKLLGDFPEMEGRARGRDGIWRLYAHNTVVWWSLAFGVSGLFAILWLTFRSVQVANVLDGTGGGWRRSALAVFVILVGIGGVISQEPFWCVLGAVHWAALSGEEIDILSSRRVRKMFGPSRSWPVTRLRNVAKSA